MKKTFTLILLSLMAMGSMAQNHGAMLFAGASTMKVSTTEIPNACDTISFLMNSASTGDITLPAMQGMGTMPSFTIEGVTFSMGENHVVSFPEQTFSSTVSADGVEKSITGSSLSGTYNMADNSLSLSITFQYGSMPLPMTYVIKAYYIKAITSSIDVVVGGSFSYSNESVTYKVRKYTEGDVTKVDVEVPTFSLQETVMGNLVLGTYIVKGLTYDEEKGGFYRDYKDDGLTFHFSAEQNGVTTMDDDYTFNSEKDNNILVKYSGSSVESIVNTFQMGAMPFGIVSTFRNTSSGIREISTSESEGTSTTAAKAVYSISGQRVGSEAKGLLIENGRIVIK